MKARHRSCVTRTLLTGLVVLIGALAYSDRLSVLFIRNRVVLSYVNVYGGHDGDVRKMIAELTNLDPTDHPDWDRQKCYLQNLQSYQDSEAQLSYTHPQICRHLLSLEGIRTSLPLDAFESSARLHYLESGELELRRNGTVWMAIMIKTPGIYEIRVRAYCTGPAPAIARLTVSDIEEVVSFGNTPESHSIRLDAEHGVQWIAMAFTNDMHAGDKDRNLRVMEVEIEQNLR